jgi:hypothetical protein
MSIEMVLLIMLARLPCDLMEEFAMSLRLIPLALLFGTSSALAFDTSKLGQWGSLFLDDLTPVIAKSDQLQQEINEVLSQGNKKPEDVRCFGMRFPGQWKTLGGYRVSPYTCDFGGMWLHRRGQAFETITTKAMNNATNVSETNLNWKWTTEFPPEVPIEMREWIGPRG